MKCLVTFSEGFSLTPHYTPIKFLEEFSCFDLLICESLRNPALCLLSHRQIKTQTTVCVLCKCLHNKPRVVFDNDSLITQLICKHNGMYSIKTSALFYTTRSILSLCFGFKASYLNEDQPGVFTLLLNYGTDRVDPVSTLYSLHAAWPAIQQRTI
jgi:hypothetical protein